MIYWNSTLADWRYLQHCLMCLCLFDLALLGFGPWICPPPVFNLQTCSAQIRALLCPAQLLKVGPRRNCRKATLAICFIWILTHIWPWCQVEKKTDLHVRFRPTQQTHFLHFYLMMLLCSCLINIWRFFFAADCSGVRNIWCFSTVGTDILRQAAPLCARTAKKCSLHEIIMLHVFTEDGLGTDECLTKCLNSPQNINTSNHSA